MLARLSIALPFAFHVPAEIELKPIDVQWNGRPARLFPLRQSKLLAEAGADQAVASSLIAPADNAVVSPYVQIDNAATHAVDLMEVEFHSDSYDRSPSQVPERDSLIEDGFALVNRWTTTYRNLMSATWVKPVAPQKCSWRLNYLNDDGTELAQEEGLIRASVGFFMNVPGVGALVADSWQAIGDLVPDYVPFRWDELLVDALELLPAIGPPILLAYTALEIRISDAADVLATERKVHAEVWEWFTLKRAIVVRPETEEFAKAVFRMLAGKSLADETELWQTFVDLRRARNSFAHEGVARDSSGKEVTPDKAAQLVAGARQVLDWIENLLPESNRRKQFAPTSTLTIVTPAIRVQ